ncbi:MAG TPA: primosomal protein N', partial [Candidatus Limnocylindrales bacterium]|nr:primosomal protein N' [Candidatus Limnocylindrales bacterium]
RTLRGPFDYRIPEDGPEVAVGSLLVVPFARRRILGVVTGLAASSALAPERLSEPLEVLETPTTPELLELGEWVAERYCSARSRGIALTLPPGAGAGARARSAQMRIETRSQLSEAGRAALAGEQRLGSRQRRALEALAERGELSNPELARLAGADAAVVRRLSDRGLVDTRRAQVRRRPALPTVGESGPAPRLSAAQRAAAEGAVRALDDEGPREQLLFGVTGSGKTEVYLAAIEAALDRGRSAILLVPEIGLTPQTLARVSARLGDAVAVLHSGLSEGERYDEWRRLRLGDARVCVGPRSAIFAPLEKLGIVIVDEEHDASYKQEGDPRYDARAVARRRAERAGAAYLAGSATPRPESWAELARLELPERVDARPMPAVELLDMREVSPRSGPLHPEVRQALGGLQSGEKAIVMLNRRGYAPHLSCSSCGHSVGCPNCDVSLVMHRAGGRMSCHHCGHSEAVPRECPECGSVALARFGAGTERLESLLSELVAPHEVIRLDADIAARRGAHGELLERFGAGQGGVLVGTQMVAKGHDFADVVLSVLLDADSTLRYPDFRAEERTFALVSQLAGRSGRGERGGRVLVQTLAPEATPMLAAARHDAAGFLAAELERRRQFSYPPFSSLIAIELAGSEEAALAQGAERVAAEIEPLVPAGSDSELLGPAPRFRRRGKFRRRLLIKTTDPAAVTAAIGEAIEKLQAERSLAGLALAIDVDPQ